MTSQTHLLLTKKKRKKAKLIIEHRVRSVVMLVLVVVVVVVMVMVVVVTVVVPIDQRGIMNEVSDPYIISHPWCTHTTQDIRHMTLKNYKNNTTFCSYIWGLKITHSVIQFIIDYISDERKCLMQRWRTRTLLTITITDFPKYRLSFTPRIQYM